MDRTNFKAYLLIFIATAGIFILDILSPAGYAVWLGYLFPLWMASRVFKRKKIIYYAGLCSILTLVDVVYLKPGPDFYEAIFNRLFGICVLGVTAVLIVKRGKAEDALERSRGHQKISEEEARELGEKLQILVEEALVGAYIIRERRFVFVNRRTCEMLGYSMEELLGLKDMLEIVHPDDREMTAENMRKRLEGEARTAHYEIRLLRHDGKTILAEALGSVSVYKGKPSIIGSLIDITERREAEAKMRASEKRLLAILENIPDMAWLKDVEGRYLAVNGTFADACGIRAEDIPGKRDMDIWPSELAGKYMADDRKVAQTGKRVVSEERLVDARGNERWIETIKTPLFNEKKELNGTIGIAREITERKKLEQQKTDFYAMVTHDLKSPLTAILGYTQLLLSGDRIDGETREMISVIQDSGEKVYRLVESYLTISKTEAGKMTLDLSPTDVAEALREAARGFEGTFKPKGLSFKIEVADGIPKALLDRKLLQRAVSNLLQNAANYTPRGGEITMKAEPVTEGGGDFIVISVDDSGKGIPAEEREVVFEKYYRSPRSAGIKGTGLGLAIVKAVAEAHGGRVELTSKPGTGSSFRLFLPLR
jgi:PAS domain S-box-containing protein